MFRGLDTLGSIHVLSYEYSYLLERLLVFVGGTQAVKVYTLDSSCIVIYEYSYLWNLIQARGV